MNLWAVVEYITKYATKAPSGSRRLVDVSKDAVAGVSKHLPKEQEHAIGWRSLQKFYSRMLGERDYSLFEAVHVGLGLPLMHSLMPVVSLNTLGVLRRRRSSWRGVSQMTLKIDELDNRL